MFFIDDKQNHLYDLSDVDHEHFRQNLLHDFPDLQSECFYQSSSCLQVDIVDFYDFPEY